MSMLLFTLTPSMPSFGHVSAPLLPTYPTTTDAQAVPPPAEQQVLHGGEPIDLDQLTDLLSSTARTLPVLTGADTGSSAISAPVKGWNTASTSGMFYLSALNM